MMGRVDAAGGPTTLDTVEAFAAAAERFAVAVAVSDMRAAVASCPGWSTYDLVVHLGNVHAWAATIVETGSPAVEQNDEPRSGRSKVVSAWYAGKAEDLYEVLRDSEPDRPCWNFAFGTGVVGFWPRRQLHETTMHQIDLDTARGADSELDPRLCVDGIEEVLTVMLHRMHRRGHPTAIDAPLVLTATDTGDTWVVSPQAGSSGSSGVPTQPVGDGRMTPPPYVEHRRDPPVAVADRLEAPADVLYRLLWHRPADLSGVRVSGDPERVDGFMNSRLTP